MQLFTIILFLFAITSPTLGILNTKAPQQLKEVYSIDSGFQTGGNYRPARAPETLLGTEAPFFSQGEFQQESSNNNPRPYYIPKKCPQCQCSAKNTFICGSNRKVYRSQCAFSCAQLCDPGLYKRSMSHCV